MGGYGTKYGSPAYGYETLGVPPELQNLDPYSGETGVPIGKNLILEIFDDISGLDIYTVMIWINGVAAWEDNLPNPGFSGSKTPITNGYRYEINPDDNFPNFSWVTIGVYAESSNGGILDEEYQFQTSDEIGPALENRNPRENERYVEINRPIIFDLVDSNGVDESSIEIYVDNVPAWLSDTQQSGFTVTKTAITDGFNFNIVPDSTFAYEATIPVRVVSAEDPPSSTTSDHTYSFMVSAVEPEIIFQNPESNGNAGTDTHIIVGIQHKYNIRLDSIRIWIKPSADDPYEIAFNGYNDPPFTTKYDGPYSEVAPLAKGFKITLDRVENFTIGKQITAHVHVAADD
jgi:hypothetical protein